MTTRDVTFRADARGHGLSPCLTRGQLASMGVDTGRVPGMATLDSTACVPLATLISEATTRFDVGQQRLYLTVPGHLWVTMRAAIFRRSCGITVSPPG